MVVMCCVVGPAGCGAYTTNTKATTGSAPAREGTADATPKPKTSEGNPKQEQIVGTWEVARSDEEMATDARVPPKGAAPPAAALQAKMPPKATVEFTKDHKVKITAKVGEQVIRRDLTYEVNDDKLTTVERKPGGKDQTDTVTIVLLTDSRMVTKDANAKIVEFRKK
jgi:uncharacterized protein (TIGR03066 family)